MELSIQLAERLSGRAMMCKSFLANVSKAISNVVPKAYLQKCCMLHMRNVLVQKLFLASFQLLSVSRANPRLERPVLPSH
jgi:hypothetical protein